MKLQKIHRISVNIILILFITLFCLSSCSVKAEQKSLTAQFETIDALIRQNQFKDAVKDLKKLEKNHEITEDDLKKALDDVQKATDKTIKEIDQVVAEKEKEIMEV